MTYEFCIYCDEQNPARFAGREHVIPQAFGKFGTKTPTLKCVCDNCNEVFGKELDQMLARETYEGVLRYNQGRTSREKRLQRRLRFTLADEDEAGSFLGAVVVGLDSTNSQLLPLATQLHIKNILTGKTDIMLRNQFGNFSLLKEDYGPPGQRELTIYAPSKDEHDAFVRELNELGFDVRMDAGTLGDIKPSLDVNGSETLSVHIEGTFDQLHRRALAKILINFAAFYLGTEVVNSREWLQLKRFVRYGEGALGARLSNKPFWTGQETDSQRFPDAINIRIENHARGIVGIIQFYNRITYELLLVENSKLTQEMAARFVDGEEPMFGTRQPLR